MNSPLVSVICLCYNQAGYVEEAIQSVLDQTYRNIEIIVVDDGSTDNSATVIKKAAERQSFQILLLGKNIGNCAAFNKGLDLAKGDFVVDFAADDVMIPTRIAEQVEFFSTLPPDYGVVFTDAQYIDARGNFLRNHYEYLSDKGLVKKIPEGDVYRDVISKYFISTPTMLIRREVLVLLNGYDENLAYEDFDFWVRSARKYRYGFLNRQLTKVRRTGASMSSRSYRKGDKQLHSTYLVCRKAQQLSSSIDDNKALISRVRYELRQCCFSGNFYEGKLFYALLKELTTISLNDRLLNGVMQLRLPLNIFRDLYHKVRFNR